jgi:hypothetical protein
VAYPSLLGYATIALRLGNLRAGVIPMMLHVGHRITIFAIQIGSLNTFLFCPDSGLSIEDLLPEDPIDRILRNRAKRGDGPAP